MTERTHRSECGYRGQSADPFCTCTAALEAANADLVEALLAVEWGGASETEYGPVCPSCAVPKRDGKHASYCVVDAALRKAGRTGFRHA